MIERLQEQHLHIESKLFVGNVTLQKQKKKRTYFLKIIRIEKLLKMKNINFVYIDDCF